MFHRFPPSRHFPHVSPFFPGPPTPSGASSAWIPPKPGWPSGAATDARDSCRATTGRSCRGNGERRPCGAPWWEAWPWTMRNGGELVVRPWLNHENLWLNHDIPWLKVVKPMIKLMKPWKCGFFDHDFLPRTSDETLTSSNHQPMRMIKIVLFGS